MSDQYVDAQTSIDRRGDEISAAVEDVRGRIAQACAAARRAPSEVRLVAVTKTWPVSDIQHLASLGVHDVGENRHQDAKDKAAAFPELDWHFLGQLQSNKARAVAHYASWVHSVDREPLIAGLSQGARDADREIDVLLQLSLDGDMSRGGCLETELSALADGVAAADGLRLRGLMTVAPVSWEPRRAFTNARLALDRLALQHPQATELSAGMSGDFEVAVEEGSTIVRVGSAIFGRRAPQVG